MGYSKRAYGDAGTAFLKQLKTARTADINTMATYKLPVDKAVRSCVKGSLQNLYWVGSSSATKKVAFTLQ